MRVAVIGSRAITVNRLGDYLPKETSMIISGGAAGVDSSAAAYAKESGIPLLEIRPDYKSYGKGAPLKRNLEIIESAELVLAFWDGQSRGTAHVIANCKRLSKPCKVFVPGQK